MPVSYHMSNGKWGVTIEDPLEPQSLETVRRMLDAGEIYSVGLSKIDVKILSSLNLAHINKIAISGLPCSDLGFLSPVKNLESLHLGYSLSPSIGKTIRLETIPSMESLTSLLLGGVTGLNGLPDFPNLKILDLRKVKGLNRLPQFPKLETLILDEINETLSFLELYPSIKALMISGSTMQGANHLLRCKNLLRLCMIQDRKIDFGGMIADGTVNDSLKILEISHCPSLTDFGFLKLFPGLKYMDIGSSRNIISFNGIEDCKNLEVVNFSNCRVADKSLQYLVNIPKISVGIKYSKEELSLFDKEFKGDHYYIYGAEKGEFDYLTHYEKFFRKPIDKLTVDSL